VIDFRFHLVSIVSIFLALAVGIVLGAGPLQAGLGTTLTDQVKALRDEKDTLRAQLDDSTKVSAAEDQYAALVAPDALRGRLAGRSVVLVVTPESSGRFSQDVQRAITQGGGRISTVVTLRDPYFDPSKAADRASLANQLASSVGAVATTGNGDDLLAAVLGRVLLRPPSQDDPAPIEGGIPALSKLKDAGFIDFTQTDLRRANLAVILSGSLSGATDAVVAQSATGLALVRYLDAAGSGAVVAAGQPGKAVGQAVTTNLVTVVRKDSTAAGAVSTVDHADSAMGAGVVVLTLAAQRTGATGHYGISADARSLLPAIP